VLVQLSVVMCRECHYISPSLEVYCICFRLLIIILLQTKTQTIFVFCYVFHHFLLSRILRISMRIIVRNTAIPPKTIELNNNRIIVTESITFPFLHCDCSLPHRIERVKNFFEFLILSL
jgi:hypothetical protein